LVSHFEGEHGLTVSEKRVMTFGRNMEEDVSWSKLHKDECHSLFVHEILLG